MQVLYQIAFAAAYGILQAEGFSIKRAFLNQNATTLELSDKFPLELADHFFEHSWELSDRAFALSPPPLENSSEEEPSNEILKDVKEEFRTHCQAAKPATQTELIRFKDFVKNSSTGLRVSEVPFGWILYKWKCVIGRWYPCFYHENHSKIIKKTVQASTGVLYPNDFQQSIMYTKQMLEKDVKDREKASQRHSPVSVLNIGHANNTHPSAGNATPQEYSTRPKSVAYNPNKVYYRNSTAPESLSKTNQYFEQMFKKLDQVREDMAEKTRREQHQEHQMQRRRDGKKIRPRLRDGARSINSRPRPASGTTAAETRTVKTTAAAPAAAIAPSRKRGRSTDAGSDRQRKLAKNHTNDAVRKNPTKMINDAVKFGRGMTNRFKSNFWLEKGHEFYNALAGTYINLDNAIEEFKQWIKEEGAIFTTKGGRARYVTKKEMYVAREKRVARQVKELMQAKERLAKRAEWEKQRRARRG